MKVRITTTFRDRLNNQIEFISKDKPLAARNFKVEIIRSIRDISLMPYKHRKSIYFENEEIRDLIFKGYVIVYRINKTDDTIEVFGFAKYLEKPI